MSLQSHQRLVALMGKDPLEIIEQLRSMSAKKSFLKSRVEMLEHFRKKKLAEISMKIRESSAASGERMTEGLIEDKALSSTEYAEFLNKSRKMLEDYQIVDDEFWALKDELNYIINGLVKFTATEAYIGGKMV